MSFCRDGEQRPKESRNEGTISAPGNFYSVQCDSASDTATTTYEDIETISRCPSTTNFDNMAFTTDNPDHTTEYESLDDLADNYLDPYTGLSDVSHT